MSSMLSAVAVRDAQSGESVPSVQRQVSVDALRGFALFGILVVNINAFASPYYGSGLGDPTAVTVYDRIAQTVVALLFETKFYLLFSFLFGYSFTLQMQSAEHAGAAFVPRLLRRQAGLWVIGVLHAVLLFSWEILTTYAVLGVVLLLMRHWHTRTLARLAIALVVVTALGWLVTGVLATLAPSSPAVTGTSAADVLQAYRGTPGTVVMQHLRELPQSMSLMGLMQAPTALAMFIGGLLAGRERLFTRIPSLQPQLRQLLIAGVAVGAPGAALYAYGSAMLAGTSWELMTLSVDLITAPLLSAAYAVALLLWFQTSCGSVAARVLAAAGRTALSNYLLQSLVCAVIFHAYGLRLMGSVGPALLFALAVVIFAAQLVVSRWWMSRFAYGPVEWLLRMVTNLQRPPLLRSV